MALALATGACATSGGLPDEPVVKDYEAKEWVASPKSGLRVIVKEDRSAPQVVIASVYGSGASSDPKGAEGLAHFIEHLAFRSRPGGGPQYWDVLKRLGASFNAYTSHDVTGYWTVAHKSKLHELMQLEAWRLARTIEGVTPQVFNTEREVVRNELRQRWETSGSNKMFGLILDGLFPDGHPLRRPVGGTHEALTAVTLEHAQTFVKDHYRPDNCTIVISGDFDTNEVKEMLGMWPAEVLFGPEGPDGAAVPPRARLAERKAPEVPKQPQSRELKRHKGPIAEPELILAWALPPGYRGQDEIARFAAHRLNLALGLGLETKEDDEIRGASAGVQVFADSSVMFMSATLKPSADPEKARKRLEDVLVNAWTTNLGRLQTEAARWGTATRVLMQSADPVSSAEQLATYAAATGNHAFFSDKLQALAALKEQEVSDFAYQWLTRERAAAIYFEPESAEMPRFVAGGGGDAGGARQGEHTIGREVAAADVNLGPEQIRKVIVSPELGATPKFKLGNGLDVYVIPRPGAPIARIELALRGGNVTTRPVGAASIATGFSRTKCSDHGSLTPVGGSMGAFVSLARSSTSVTVLSGNLANGIAVLSDEVRCQEADEEAFLHALPRTIERRTKSFEQQAKRPEFVASKRFYAALYPDHPFGQVRFVDPSTLKDLKVSDAQAFVSSHFRPDNGAVVAYGDVDLETVRKESERYLTAWTPGGGGGSMEPPPPPAGPSARHIFLVDRPKASQAEVTIGCRLADARPEWLPAFDVLDQLANERAWSLREDWGATYGVHANVGRLPGTATELTFGGAIENAQVAKSVRRVLGIVDELGSGKIDERLFATKRWDAGLNFMREFATADARAEAILEATMRRWPLEVYDKYPDRLATTTPATLKEILAPCVGKEVVAIVGDAATLRPQLEKEGLKLAAK